MIKRKKRKKYLFIETFDLLKTITIIIAKKLINLFLLCLQLKDVITVINVTTAPTLVVIDHTQAEEEKETHGKKFIVNFM